MHHQQYIEYYLSADVDGELSPAEQQVVSAHLATCPGCRDLQSAEHSIKALLRQRFPVVPAPDDLRRKIIAAIDAETPRPASAPACSAQVGRVRITRRPLWMGSLAALAAAAIALIMVRGLGQQPTPPNAFDSAIKEYIVSERNFASNPALRSPTEFASALALELGYPYIWEFSPLGLNLVGARIDHRPNGKTIAYGLYKGPRGSILCINFRQLAFKFPPGGQIVHGVRFYGYGDFTIGVVNYGSVFCYLVSRFTPRQIALALVVPSPPKSQTS
jgi:hypothetical protein